MCQVPDRALRTPKQSKRRHDVHRFLPKDNGIVLTRKTQKINTIQKAALKTGSLLYFCAINTFKNAAPTKKSVTGI
jgi:hypothetical protein